MLIGSPAQRVAHDRETAENCATGISNWQTRTRRSAGMGKPMRSMPDASDKARLATSSEALQHFRDHHPPAVVSGGNACLKKSNKPRRKAKP
jgi:hypothetical protein